MDFEYPGISEKNTVSTDSGVKKASEIKQGDRIISGCGYGKIVFTQVRKIHRKLYNGPACLIKTRHSRIHLTRDQLVFARFDPKTRYQSVFLAKNDSGFFTGIAKNKIHFLHRSFIPQCYWIIECFETEAEAIYFMKRISYTYGIPHYDRSSSWDRITESDMTKLFAELKSEERAEKLMKDCNINPEFFYYHEPKPGQITTGILNLIFYGDAHYNTSTSSYEHRVVINRATAYKNFPYTRSGNDNKNVWIVDVSKKNLPEVIEFSNTLASLDSLKIIQYCQLFGKTPYMIIPAAHLKRGMIVPVLYTDTVSEDIIESVEPIETSSSIYHFEFDNEYNNLAANNIFVHK